MAFCTYTQTYQGLNGCVDKSCVIKPRVSRESRDESLNIIPNTDGSDSRVEEFRVLIVQLCMISPKQCRLIVWAWKYDW